MIGAVTLVVLFSVAAGWVVVAHKRLVRAQDRIHDTWGVLEDTLERRHDPLVALARRAQGRLGVPRNAAARVERLAFHSRQAHGPVPTARAEIALDAEVAGLLHAAALPDAPGDPSVFGAHVDEALAAGMDLPPEDYSPSAGALRRDGLGGEFHELEFRRDGLGADFEEFAQTGPRSFPAGDGRGGLVADPGGEEDFSAVQGYESFGDLNDLPDLDNGLGEYLAEIGEVPEAGAEVPATGGPDDLLRRMGKLTDRAAEAAREYNKAASAMNGMIQSLQYGFAARVFGYRPVSLYKPRQGEKKNKDGRTRRV